MKRGVTLLRRLEEERLAQLSSVSRLFLGIMMTNRPKMISLTERLREPVDLCNVARDSEVMIISIAGMMTELLTIQHISGSEQVHR